MTPANLVCTCGGILLLGVVLAVFGVCLFFEGPEHLQLRLLMGKLAIFSAPVVFFAVFSTIAILHVFGLSGLK